MMRYLEYVYLLCGLGLAIYLGMNLSNMEIGAKIGFSVAAMLCSFMYTFRRKQRQMMEKMDEEERDAPADSQEQDDN